MDNRRKELYKQAGIKLSSAQFSGVLECEISEFELDALVKLIIGHANECVRDVLRDEASNVSYDDASKIQDKIKEYFGITYGYTR